MTVKSIEELHHFIIKFDNQTEMTGQLLDDIFEVGCDDGIVCSIGDNVYVEFNRDGRIFEEALSSALDDLSKIPYLFNQMSVVSEMK